MSATSRKATGGIAVDAKIASPDSPAGKNTLPTWGQALAEADILNGFYLPQRATSITFTVTFHISKAASALQGVSTLPWVSATALIDARGIDCRCAHVSSSWNLPATSGARKVVESLTLSPGGVLSRGTFLVETGFSAVAGLKSSPGFARMIVYGTVTKIVASYVAAR